MVVAAGDEPDDALNEQLTRGEIVRHAQPFCDASYDHSERGTWVTAWNGMKTLVNKGYVAVQGIPHRYTLTEAGL
jgi:crossover junction endonuclease MUS81